MHPRIAELVSFIDVEREGVEEALEAVPPQWRERRQSPEAWTAAEVIDHLARVESGVARVVARRSAKAREAGVGAETSETSVLDRLDHDQISGTRKLMAPEIVRPAPGVGAVEAITALREAREALRASLEAADGLALGEIFQAHAALGELDLYQWVLFVGLHERRHARQLRAIAEWSRAAEAGESPPVAESSAARSSP